MKITIYELLGMVKDGKEPKEVKYNNDVYVYVKKYGDYQCENTLLYLLDKIIRNNDYNKVLALNDEVEILEEEKKIPEKIDVISWDKCIHNVTHKEKELAIEINKTQELLNQVIDYLNSKGDE